MVAIAADDAEIGRRLERMLAQARDAGGAIADDLILRCAGGSLSVELPPDSAAETLIDLPEQALLPVGAFGLSLQGGDIALDSVDAAVAPARRALMESMLALYNLTSKIAWYRRTSPVLFLRARPDLASLVARGCDARMQHRLTDRLAADEHAPFLLQRFIGTRSLDFRVDPGAPAGAVLAPIVDLLNHDIKAPPFREHAGPSGRRLRVARPRSVPGNPRECFVQYGFYDPLETLLRYNFTDESAEFLRSVPAVITLAGIGTINVRAGRSRSASKGLPAPLKALADYLPKIVTRQPRYLEVAFLAIPATPALSHALRRVLNLLIATLDSDHLDRLDLIVAAEDQILAANRAHYQELRRALAAAAPGAPASPVLAELARACDLQIARLQAYDDMVRSLPA
jgi:hypothetical protein